MINCTPNKKNQADWNSDVRMRMDRTTQDFFIESKSNVRRMFQQLIFAGTIPLRSWRFALANAPGASAFGTIRLWRDLAWKCILALLAF